MSSWRQKLRYRRYLLRLAAPAAVSRATLDMVSPVRVMLQRSQDNVRNALEQKHLNSRNVIMLAGMVSRAGAASERFT